MCTTHDLAHITEGPSFLAGLPAAEDALGFARTLVAYSPAPVPTYGWDDADAGPEPEAHEPCDPDCEGGSCEPAPFGGWVREINRRGCDIMVTCFCEHHGAIALSDELAR